MNATDKHQQEIQSRDTCLALTFLLLLIWFVYPRQYLIYAAIGLLLVGMILPRALRIPARLWFGLSHILGTVVSKIVLTAIYIVFLFPIGIFRRMIGKDPMRLSSWRDGKETAFVSRDHTFAPRDLNTPY